MRVISVEQGEDPRHFTLVAFGGAGPLHAADVARTIGIREVLVPPRPGLLSALGLFHAEVRGDFKLTRLVRSELKSGIPQRGVRRARRTRRPVARRRRRKKAQPTAVSLICVISASIIELIMELGSEKLDTGALRKIVAAYHRRHKDYYGYDMREQPVEIFNLRLVVNGEANRRPPKSEKCGGAHKSAVLEKRKVWFPETGFVATPVYDRDRLPARRTSPGRRSSSRWTRRRWSRREQN